MPEQVPFKEDVFERNIAAIGERVAVEREEKRVSSEEPEAVLRVALKNLGVASVPAAADEPESAVSHISPYPHRDADLLPAYVEGNNAEAREIEWLVDMALHHDVRKALRIARRRDPFVEDAFHDALVDKILPELKKRGMI